MHIKKTLSLEKITLVNKHLKAGPGYVKPLTSRQLAFVREYLLNPDNQANAAIRAGYSKNTAQAAATSMLKDPRINKLVIEGQAKVVEETAITKERVLQELAKIAFANIGDVVDVQTGLILPSVSKEATAALSEISVDKKGVTTKVKVKMSDKTSALEKIGKHLGMFKDQLEVSGNLSIIDLVNASMAKETKSEPVQS